MNANTDTDTNSNTNNAQAEMINSQAAMQSDIIDSDEYTRRFAGVAKIYGDAAFTRFAQSHVMVIGIGGVGSWAVEALARTGIGHLTLVDMDVLAASNINRQLPALSATLGLDKAEVMAARCREINPRIHVTVIDDFLTANNVSTLLATPPDVVLDCIDDVKAKLALMLHCRFYKIPLVVSGGAGGKIDPSQVRVADLSRTEQDPMLAKLRSQLRAKGVCKKPKDKFGIQCIYSVEQAKRSADVCAAAGLRCGGYGSAVAVTNTFAMFAVAEVLKKINLAANFSKTHFKPKDAT